MTPEDYEQIDPFNVCMSALALGLVSNLSAEEVWIACNEAGNAGEFDVAIQSACRLNEVIEDYYRNLK